MRSSFGQPVPLTEDQRYEYAAEIQNGERTIMEVALLTKRNPETIRGWVWNYAPPFFRRAPKSKTKRKKFATTK